MVCRVLNLSCVKAIKLQPCGTNNMPENIKCPICGIEFSYCIRRTQHTMVNKIGKCEKCFIKEQPLIKVDNHYVPVNYRYYIEEDGSMSHERDDEFHEDVYAELPSVKWSDHRQKWKVTFTAPDIGGYDVCTIVWYFDNLEDIINQMKGVK
jgi:hypothetical protein